MNAFVIRLAVILFLFFLGAFIASATGKNFLALVVWFTPLTTWTLRLGFRKSLFIIIPFLVFADILWDGSFGPLFLAGFLLSTMTTYVAVRIESQSSYFQAALYSITIAVWASFVLAVDIFWKADGFSLEGFQIFGGVFMLQLLTSVLVFLPLTALINRTESWLDTSYRDQMKKIR